MAINIADRLVAKTTEGIVADADGLGYTDLMGASASTDTVASKINELDYEEVKLGDNILSGNTVTIVYADIATSAVTDTNGVRLTEVSSKVSNISVENIQSEDDSISITTDDDTEIVSIIDGEVNVTGSLKKNDVEVATEDDIYDLSQAMITADDDETEIEDLDDSYLTRLTNLESTTNELTSEIGTLESLTTSSKTDIVSAINELVKKIETLSNNMITAEEDS